MDYSPASFKILIVDDVPTNVMLVKAILKKEGYTLLTTDRGFKALDIIRDQKPDLVLLDIMMPEMDGYEVLEHIKEEASIKDTNVIIMSALNDMQSIVKGFMLGAIEYVTKPFQREELVKRVANRYEIFSLKRIKANLEQTIISRDTLYSVIAHDLRSPLSSLKMMNNAILMMVNKEQVGADSYEMLEMMDQTSEKIYLLLDNLLRWAKNRLNRDSAFMQETDINSIISSQISIYESAAKQKGLTLIMKDLDKPLVGIIDIDMVKAIIRNLVSNALKFTNKGDTITICTEVDGDYVKGSVSDTGIGIKMEDQDKVLDVNTNYTKFGTKNEKGTGLGLLLVKDFVNSHRGKLWFESVEGEGSTFFFTLKALNQPAPIKGVIQEA